MTVFTYSYRVKYPDGKTTTSHLVMRVVDEANADNQARESLQAMYPDAKIVSLVRIRETSYPVDGDV